MRLILLVVLLTTLCNTLTLRMHTVMQPLMWLPLFLGYGALAALAIWQLHKQQALRARLSLRGGDVSIGVMLGLFLLAGAWLIKTKVIPADSEREAWLFQVQALLGSLTGPVPVALALVLLAATEEIVWRGFVAHELKAKLGQRRALPLATALYAATLLPTIWTLSDPIAGPNPLLFLAALGAGLAWTTLSLITGRIVAVWVSHAVFVFFVSSPPGFWRIL